jgi:lipopolysaccharide/colanic/teichoic acid biosynthesis glycosyltransferase
MSYRGKRFFDLALVSLGGIVFVPVGIVTALLVRMKLGSPVIFRQVRAGFSGEPFTIYKFRTMRDDRDGEGALLPDHERLTNFGTLLRSTSLDELPELWNIVKGDMSVVGPRPLLVDYLPYYRGREPRRHMVRPGITGLSQVNGRNNQSWDRKLSWDVAYVDRQSMWLDVRIIMRTLTTVIRREGISIDGHATPPRLDAERANAATGDSP